MHLLTILILVAPLFNLAQTLHLPSARQDTTDEGLGTAGNSVEAIACVSQDTFNVLVEGDTTGCPHFTSDNRITCAIDCRGDGANYAYFRHRNSECFCGNTTQYPTPHQMVNGTDDIGTCHRRDASVDYLHSPFIFDACYTEMNITGTTGPLVSTNTSTMEDCTNFCEDYVYDFGTVGIASQYDSGTEGLDFKCDCYEGSMPGGRGVRCGPNRTWRYYSTFQF